MDWRTRTAGVGATAFVILSTLGCAHGVELRAISSVGAPPSRYVTFFVLPANSSGNPDIDRRLNAEIETALADKGLVQTSPEEAEAVIVVHTATPARRSRDVFYQGWGGWGWRPSDTGLLGNSESYTAGSVVVDMFDAWTKKLVWHGFARNAVSTKSRQSDHALTRAVTTMFAGFPSAGSDTGARAAVVHGAADTAARSMNIIFSPRPAVLVEIDGDPKYEDLAGTSLQRIVNANATIIRDETGMHYLRVAGRWMEAYDAIGPWSFAGTVPDGANVALYEAMHKQHSDLFDAISAHDSTPVVLVSTRPAALIVTDGEPEYAAMDGTSLLRIRNTSATVFKEPTDKELYVHLLNGWFRAWTTNGPWQPVSEADLPADLAQIARSASDVPAKAGQPDR